MIELKNINYHLPNFCLTDINLRIDNGEYIVLLGESGSGKTLLLDIIAGFRFSDAGQLIKNEKDITFMPIHKRKFAYVTAEYSLFPHYTVKKNLLFASSPSNEEFEEICTWFKLTDLLKKYPGELSSGEKQRVSLARAILSKPDALLLDEPLSSVDMNARYDIVLLLRELHRKGNTIIHVTHDIQEALLLSERVAIMQKGKIVQEGLLTDIMKNPINSFVAKLTGIKNVYKAIRVKSQHFRIPPSIDIMATAEVMSEKCLIIIESNEIVLSKEKLNSSIQNAFQGIVKDIIVMETSVDVIVDIGVLIHATITQKSLNEMGLSVGQSIWVNVKASAVRLVATDDF